jgi:hypothetical protein
VNNAPIASGASALTGVTSSDQNPTGDTVSDLFGGNFSDAADQQQSASNPDGSVANTLAGIAITGNTATAAQGSWEYSTNGGTSWVVIPTTGLGDGNATVISASAELRFVSNGSFSGTPGDLTVRLIDNSSGAITGAETGVDVSENGGITAISAGTVDLSTTITADAPPILTPPPPPTDTVDAGDPSSSLPQQPSQLPLGNPILSSGHNGIFDTPIIPQVSLIGTVADKFIIEQQQATIPLPGDLFQDTDLDADLTYEARSSDGGPLPPWLNFDPRNLTFQGRPPVDSHGTVDVVIIATDQYGNEAEASFHIQVGRPVGDLTSLLQQQMLNAPPEAHVIQAPGHPGHDQPVPGPQGSIVPPPHHHPTRMADAGQSSVVDLFASIARPAQAGAHGRPGFSAQLRDAGRHGQFAQARELLDRIALAKPAKPAA